MKPLLRKAPGVLPHGRGSHMGRQFGLSTFGLIDLNPPGKRFKIRVWCEADRVDHITIRVLKLDFVGPVIGLRPLDRYKRTAPTGKKELQLVIAAAGTLTARSRSDFWIDSHTAEDRTGISAGGDNAAKVPDAPKEHRPAWQEGDHRTPSSDRHACPGG